MSHDNNVAKGKEEVDSDPEQQQQRVPKTHAQRNKDKRKRKARRDAEKRMRKEEPESEEEILEDPSERSGFCSFLNKHSLEYCTGASELNGYCLGHSKLRVVKVLKEQAKLDKAKTREYVNAKRTLQRKGQELTRQERLRRQDQALEMERQAMAANNVAAAQFDFTIDVPPLEEDDLAAPVEPQLILPVNDVMEEEEEAPIEPEEENVPMEESSEAIFLHALFDE
jgi:hypothetical protein